MVCPVCNSEVGSEKELNGHRRDHAVLRSATMTPAEKGERRRGLQALFDLEELRAKYPGF